MVADFLMGDLLHRVVRNNVWSVIGTLGTAALGIVLSAAVIRLLGVANAGFATAALGLLGLVMTIGSLGLSSALVREVSVQRERGFAAARTTMGVVLSVALTSGLAGGALFALGANWIVRWADYGGLTADAVAFCVLTGAGFVFAQWSTALLATLDGAQRSDCRTGIVLGTLALQCAATVAGLHVAPSLLTLGWINAGAAFTRALVAQEVCRRVIGFAPRPGWARGVLAKHWRFARWIYAQALSTLLLQGGDRVLLVSTFGSAQLPYYTMARRFFEVGHEALNAPGSYLFPLLSGAGEHARAMTANLDDRLRWFIAAISVWIYGGVLLVGPMLLQLLVSAEFAFHARPATAVFAAVGFIHAQSIFPFYAAMADGRPKVTFVFQFACGAGALSTMFALGAGGGFSAAIAGQLWVIVPVAVLSWIEVPIAAGRNRLAALVSPLIVPAGLLCFAGAVHMGWWFDVLPPSLLVLAGLVWGIAAIPLLCRIERWRDPDSARVETLHRALGIVGTRIGLSPRTVNWVSGWRRAATLDATP